MGRHQSTSAAGTAKKKEKKGERRCKQRPQGAEPLKATASSLIYKRSLASRQPHQQGSPGDAPPVPRVTGLCSPLCEGNGTCSLPLPGSMGSWLLFIACTGAARGARLLQEGSGHSPDTATGRRLAAQRGWRKRDLFSSPFVLFLVPLELLCERARS